jgi:hypothetical protein
MSKADQRRRAQAALLREAEQGQRPNDPPRPRTSTWDGWCPGWRGIHGDAFHERSNARTDPIWRCRWCGQQFPARTEVRHGDHDESGRPGLDGTGRHD